MEEQNNQSKEEKEKIMQEVQALVTVAQCNPRNESRAITRIMEAAKRESIAVNAIYAFPHCEKLIKGASIRAAETIAKYWGNIDFGIRELYRDSRNHISDVMSYAWDLETNTRQVKTFKVTHSKFVPKSGNVIIKDSREIYEKISNEGARCLRACILGIVPNDVTEDFIAACENTLAGDNSVSILDRTIELILNFEEFGVTQSIIEKRFGCEYEHFNKKQLIELSIIYRSIKDNFQAAESFFDTGKSPVQDSNVSVKNVFEEKDGEE